MPLHLTLVPFTWQTMMMSLGDMMILRGDFSVKTADLGLVPMRPSPDTYADTANFSLYLLCSTAPPDRNIDPNIKDEHFRRQIEIMTKLRDFNDPDAAYDLARSFMRDAWDDAATLDRLAAAITNEDGIKTRNLALALQASQRANKLAEFKDPALVQTLVSVQSARGDYVAAIKVLKRALEQIEEANPAAAGLRAALEQCEAEHEKNSAQAAEE